MSNSKVGNALDISEMEPPSPRYELCAPFELPEFPIEQKQQKEFLENQIYQKYVPGFVCYVLSALISWYSLKDCIPEKLSSIYQLTFYSALEKNSLHATIHGVSTYM